MNQINLSQANRVTVCGRSVLLATCVCLCWVAITTNVRRHTMRAYVYVIASGAKRVRDGSHYAKCAQDLLHCVTLVFIYKLQMVNDPVKSCEWGTPRQWSPPYVSYPSS